MLKSSPSRGHIRRILSILGLPTEPFIVSFTLIHSVTITKPGQAKATTLKRHSELPGPPQDGLRISLGEEASFVVEDLVFHVDDGTFTCRTSIEVAPDRPLDDVLTYYREIGYEVA